MPPQAAPPPSPTDTGRPARSLAPPRWVFAALALAWAFGTSWLAFRQAPRPAPRAEPELFSADWWRYPIESQAHLRVPRLAADLNDVYPAPGTELVWAVGDGGTVVRSADGGRTWERQEVLVDSRELALALESIDEGAQRQWPGNQQQQQQQDNAPPPEAGSDDGYDEGAKGGAYLPALERGSEVPPAGQAEEPPPAPSDTVPVLGEPIAFPYDLLLVHALDGNDVVAVSATTLLVISRDGGGSWRLLAPDEEGLAAALGRPPMWAPEWSAPEQAEWRRLLMRFVLFAFGRTYVEELLVDDMQLAGDAADTAPEVDYLGMCVRSRSDGSPLRVPILGYRRAELWRGLPPLDVSLATSAALDEKQPVSGVAVDDRGTVHAFDASGATPSAQVRHELRSVFAGGESGRTFVAGAGGRAYVLEGVEAVELEVPTGVDLNAIHFDGERGWIVGDEGTVAVTRDGGASWHLAMTAPVRFDDLEFHDERLGFAIRAGELLETRDGGETWAPVASCGGRKLEAVYLPPAGSTLPAFAAGEAGLLLGSSDLFRTCRPVASATEADLTGVWFRTPQRGVVFDTEEDGGLDGSLTVDSGNTWQNLAPFRALDGEEFWESSYGQLAAHRHAWHPRQHRWSQLYAWVDGQVIWSGSSSSLARSLDDSRNWEDRPSPTESALVAVDFLDAEVGWVADVDGKLFHTRDAGRTWLELVTDEQGYERLPAPWYFAGWLVTLGLIAPVVRRPKPREARRSVEGLLVTDRPIGMADPDPLGFQPIARGISRFLRNENTQPPLTLAVTGEWGTGKSSLMNLVREDLEGRGFRPVWFNAWHHQQEEHLLAALLENVLRFGVPPLFSPSGLGYRARLVWIRARRRWVPLTLLVLAFSFTLGYGLGHPDPRQLAQRDFRVFVDGVVALVSDPEPPPAEGEAAEGAPAEDEPAADEPAAVPVAEAAPAVDRSGTRTRISWLAAILTGLGLLRGLWSSLRSFGVDPGKLVTTLSKDFDAKDFKKQASFRTHFAREFQDVSRALGPRRMLILIDDLDRCQPENVLQVLEAVNFLVTCGDCYIVLGMARDRVERCVGLGFKDVADEMVSEEPGKQLVADEENARSKRQVFAQQYLEKLVNIEIPVPRATEEQLAELAAGSGAGDDDDQERGKKSMRDIRQAVAPFAMALGLLLAAAGGYWKGMNEVTDPPPGALTTEAVALVEPEARPGGDAGDPGDSSSVPGSGGAISAYELNLARGPAGSLQPAVEEDPSFHWHLWPCLALIALAGWRLSLRPELVEKDSDRFTRALRTWQRVATARNHTPRSVKRFLNRVRYLSMLRREEEQAPTSARIDRRLGDAARALFARAWARLAGPLIRSAARSLGKDVEVPSSVEHWPELAGDRPPARKPRGPDPGRLDDELLVALGAMHHLDPKKFELGVLPDEPEVVRRIDRAKADHSKAFGGPLSVSEPQRERFLEMARGVRV